MKRLFYFPFLIILVSGFLLTGCEKGKTVSKEKESKEQVTEMAEEEAPPAEPEESEDTEEMEEEEGEEKTLAEIGSLATGGALMAPETEEGSTENNEGVAHFKEGHWEVSEKHFRKAIEVNAELPEAHYNLALTLDKLGNHGDATNHFRTALDLAPGNPKIKDSQILKDHLGM